MSMIENIRVSEFVRLPSPKDLKQAWPASPELLSSIAKHREEIRNLLLGHDPRLLCIVGPCSIHDVELGKQYAQKLAALRHELKDKLCLVMRVYFEKPRTTVGWKGLINDPHIDGTHDITTGLKKARECLLNIASLDLPAATEFLDPIVPQYIADLISWVAIGARTTESQTHREMASGLSMPVGFKNATDGGLQVAIDAMTSARHAHHFLGIDHEGLTSIVKTRGNPDVHMILRGGTQGPNYHKEDVQACLQSLENQVVSRPVLVDCSHGNSNKDYRRQGMVFEDVLRQVQEGEKRILGMMVESHLQAGKQDPYASPRKPGVSITDGCIDWKETEEILRRAWASLP